MICSIGSDGACSRFPSRGVHRVTDLETFSSLNLQDEAPMPFPVVGPLFISLLLFRLSRVLLGAWRFGLFRCV